MKTLTKHFHRYNTQRVNFLNFPESVNINNLNFYGYLKNNQVSKYKGVTIFNFDTISFLRASQTGFIHCVGLIGKITTAIILKEND